MFLKVISRKIPSNKDMSLNGPIVNALKPEYVYYPLHNKDVEYKKVVEVGSYVKMGQIILTRDDRFAHPICSSVSGTVMGVKKMWHSSGQMVEMLEIQNDFKDEAIYKSSTEFDFTKDEIISKVKNAGVVGLGGAGFPTYVKYLPTQKANLIIINAVECEPYITCGYASILEYSQTLIRGIKYIMKANGAKRAVIAIKKNYKDAIDVLKKELIKHKYIKLHYFNDTYPSGWEKYVVERITKKTYSSLPREIKVVVNNTQTAIAVAEAVENNKPLIEKVITITGEGIVAPKNLRVKIGTKLSTLISKCGGYNPDIEEFHLICGGPMTGKSIPNDELIITANITGIVILPKPETIYSFNCIGCGKCSEICPVKLTPTMIKQSYLNKDLEYLNMLNTTRCIGCGLCSYVCPSRVEISDYVYSAKEYVDSFAEIKSTEKK